MVVSPEEYHAGYTLKGSRNHHFSEVMGITNLMLFDFSATYRQEDARRRCP
jgi:hypothetical protein